MLNSVLTPAQVAVVIPARNEVDTIRNVVTACLTQVSAVIVVDDASTDGTSAAIADLPITLIRSDVQLGKGGALQKGFTAALQAGAQAVITLDGDGQHDPNDIPDFIAAANRFPDHLVLGARLKQLQCAPRQRLLANRIADFWISWGAGLPVRDSQCGHRLYPASLLNAVSVPASPEYGFVFESELLIDAARAGFAVVSVPIEARYPPHARPSHFHPARDVWRITKMMSRKILLCRLYLPGLWRSLTQRPLIAGARNAGGKDVG